MPRRLAKRARNRSGGVQMEYVILAVLVAAAVTVAVIVFSRMVAGNAMTATAAAAGEHTKAGQDRVMRAGDRMKDLPAARDHHKKMQQ